MRRPPLLHLLPAMALLLALPAGASSALREDLQSLAQGADAVVHGRVLAVTSRWNGDHTRILTDVDVEVVEALKGEPGPRVRITQPGGEVGGLGQHVAGLAAFRTGEEVVVFLGRRGGTQGAYAVRGLAQGKFRVERGARGALAVPEAASDLELVDPATGQPTASGLRPQRLDALKAAVRTALKGAK